MRRIRLVGLGGAALVLACVATIEERPARVYVTGPPPPPIAEVRSAPGASSAAWVDGYWHWNGASYVWIPGHWEVPPDGYVWVPPRYVVVDGRYVYHPGGWRVRARARADVRPR
jgi:hypothetical protein